MLKRLLPRTLFGRALLIMVLPVALAQAIASYVFYEAHWEDVSRRLALGFAGDVAVMIEIMSDRPDPDHRRLFALAHQYQATDFAWAPGAILPNQPPAFQLRNVILDRILDKVFRAVVVKPFHVDTISSDDRVTVRVQLAHGVLSAETTRKRPASSTTVLFLVWMVGAGLLLLAIGIVFLRNQMKPIRRLASVAEAFGRGDAAVTIKPAGAAEVRQATQAFLTMRERIQRMIEQRTEMLAGVSHDLRTPVTRMKLALAMLEGGAEVDALRSDVREMETMIEGYLAFARGQDAEAMSEVEVRGLLEEIVAQAERQGAAIELAPGPELYARLRPHAMRRCLMNLVDNAGRYGKKVEVAFARRNGTLAVTIDDDGPGIPPDKREEVFRPFYRLETSRNADTGGIGLGLSIARDVARTHGGDIVLGNAPLGGLRAELRIPI